MGIERLRPYWFPMLASALLTVLYFALPSLVDSLISRPAFAPYAAREAPLISEYLQELMVYPFGNWLPATARHILVFPYWLLLLLGIQYLYRRWRRVWWAAAAVAGALMLYLFLFPNSLLVFDNEAPSISHGTVSDGHIENAKRLPYQGENFTTYSFAGYLLGRTFVHERVRETVLAAFDSCRTTCPGMTFVIGETGRPHGGSFAPHRTHRNGLSVDIMTPMMDHEGNPYRRHNLFNLWGYAMELDDFGRTEDASVHYECLAHYLLALKKAAPDNGLRIQKVIFDPILRMKLLETRAGRQIRDLPFTSRRAILRHDDHFHVDFAVVEP